MKSGSHSRRNATRRRQPASAKRPSQLGERLRKLSDRALAQGTPTLSKAQIHKLISEARGPI